MAIHKLNDIKIRAKIREIEDLSYTSPKSALLGDGQGLTLAIAKNGTASWLFRYMDHGKAKSVGLGAYPGTSLKVAREKAQSMREARSNGIDPAVAKRQEIREQQLQQAKAKTFETCAAEFIEFSKPAWKNAKHAQQWTNTLKQYAYPVIGQRAIGEVDSDHVVEILMPIWQRKTRRQHGFVVALKQCLIGPRSRDGERETTLLGLRATWSTCYPKSVRAPRVTMPPYPMKNCQSS